MRDILAGGVFVQAGSPEQPVRFSKARPRRRSTRRPQRAALRRAPAAIGAAVQPGQLASPHLKSGFGSLAVH